MKILVVCQYYYPENFQITPICEQLVQDGYDVTVLTGLPNYPEGIVDAAYKTGHRDEMINGVRVIRCYEIGRKTGVVHLALNYISFCVSALMKVGKLDKDFDLVFVYQLSPILMGLPGKKYAKKRGVPMFLYCCDLWPESMKMYVPEGNIAFKLIDRISRSVYTAADKIAVQAKGFFPYLETKHKIPKQKLVYIPVFAEDKYLLSDFHPEDKTVDFVFMGNLGLAQDLLSVLKAVESIRDLKGFKVHFVGDGTVLEQMKAFVHEKGLQEQVVFYGRRPVNEMDTFYKLADACLVSLKADNQTGYSLPAKVPGYMAAGKPIIGMIDGSAREIIEESHCGICVGAGDVDGLAAAMRSFITDGQRYAQCGDNGRKYFTEHFTKSRFMEKLENELEGLCQ